MRWEMSRRGFLRNAAKAGAAAAATIVGIVPFGDLAFAQVTRCGCTEWINCNACGRSGSCRNAETVAGTPKGRCGTGVYSPSRNTFAKIVATWTTKGTKRCNAYACNTGRCGCSY